MFFSKIFLASGYWIVHVHSSLNCWKNFRSLFWKILFCFDSLMLQGVFWVSLLSPITFDLYSSCTFRLVSCFDLVFLFQCTLMFLSFLSSFTCCCRIFICPFSIISHLGFIFLFGFLKGVSVVLLNWFAPELKNTSGKGYFIWFIYLFGY